jgi:peptidoglycan/LPS O-acetylase OafA/YrhL
MEVSHKRHIGLLALLLAVCALMMFPVVAFASPGNDVGKNVANLLKGYATELYGGIGGVVSLMFLINRRYTELVVFLCAAIAVAWMVFASSDIAGAAEAIGKQIFG